MSTHHNLDYYIKELSDIFKKQEYYAAHKETAGYLQKMVEDKEILFEIIRRQLSSPNYFNSRYFGPVMGFDVFKNQDFTFGINVFLPGTNTVSVISTQSIHHHGNLLLTVVGGFGKGYESIVFKPGFKLDTATGTATMEANQLFRNAKGYASFIDAYAPHIVFFPESLNLSFTVWSTNKRQIVHTLKKSQFLLKNKALIKKSLMSVGLLNKVGLQADGLNFDFYPENGVIRQLKNRLDYPSGGIDAFIQNNFYVLQQVGFADTDFWRKTEATLTPSEKENTKKWATMWLKGEQIKCRPDAVDINNPKINFSKEDVLKCIPPLKKEQIADNV